MSVARRPDPAGDDACATPPVEDLQQRLGLDVDPALLRRALTHRSYAYENGGLPTNERLEFLGDAVLGLVVTDALYRRHPDEPEGRLAKMRAAVVNMRALAEVARSIGVGEHVLLGRGEESTGGRDKASILADTVEALLGAAYLSHGVDAAQDLVLRLVGPLLDSSSGLGAGLDWKTSLQELTSEAGLGVPEYRVEEEGPDHAKVFHASVVVDGVERGTGTGRSKKEAEQQAASTAWAAVGGREQSGEEAAATPSSCAHEEGPAAVPAGGPGAAVPAGTAPR